MGLGRKRELLEEWGWEKGLQQEKATGVSFQCVVLCTLSDKLADKGVQ